MVSQRIDEFLQSLSQEELDAFAADIGQLLGFAGGLRLSALELLLTNDCTFRCDYCFVEGKCSGSSMPPATAKSAIDFTLRYSGDRDAIEITLFGGEPLLEFPLIREIVPYAEEQIGSAGKKVSWTLTTNGHLIDHENMEYFRDHEIHPLLSIDGNRDTQDKHRRLASGGPTFDLVFPKIALMKEYQPWLGTRMTVNVDTIRSLADDVRFLHEAGINQFLMAPNFDTLWTNWDLAILRDQYTEVAKYYLDRKSAGSDIRMTLFEESPHDMADKMSSSWGCEAGNCKLCVTPDGRLFTCAKYAAQDGGKGRYCIGDMQQGITAPKLVAEMQDHRVNIRYKCMTCNYAPYCAGGCPADNLEKTGSIYVPPEQYCFFIRTSVDILHSMPALYAGRHDGNSSTEDQCQECTENAELASPETDNV